MAYIRKIHGRIPILKEAAVTVTMGDTVTEEEEDSAVRTIKGFASMRGIDRDGDDIDPFLFDIATFMKNPQLWIDHKKWLRDDGNEVNAGMVEFMAVAEVHASEYPDMWDIIDAKSGEKIDSVIRDDRNLFNEGDIGLWIVAKVMEPDIVKLIDETRIRTFSWSGSLIGHGDNPPDRIDLREVSLVYLPAHTGALFFLDKEASEIESYFVRTSKGFHEIFDLPEKMKKAERTLYPYSFYLIDEEGGVGYFVCKSKNHKDVERRATELFVSSDGWRTVLVLKHTGMATEYEEDIYEVLDGFSRSVAVKKEEKSTSEGDSASLTDTEEALLEQKDEKGGEQEMAEDNAVLEELKSAIQGLNSQMEALAEKITVSAVPKNEDKSEQTEEKDATESNAVAEDLSQIKESLSGVASKLEAFDTRIAELEGVAQKSSQEEDKTEEDELKEKSWDEVHAALTGDERTEATDRLLGHILTARPSRQ